MRGAGKRDNGDLEASVFAGFLSTVLPVPSRVGKMPGSVATEESGRQTRGTPLAGDYPLQDLRKKDTNQNACMTHSWQLAES